LLGTLAIAFMIILLSMSRHSTQFMSDWGNAYKTMALIGGTLVIAVTFITESNSLELKKLKPTMIMLGCILIASFFIVSGYAHFKFADFVIQFIPAYIPFRPFWTYFCGICLAAGGVGILIPPTRRLAALLSGIMVLGWFLLLHIPRFVGNMNDFSDRLGLAESFTFAGIFFALAGVSKKTA
jgi:uncharacterized membrane protein YphA (DoxX/SURF4 family)